MLKRDVLEIETTLFTACNLRCSFCFENIYGVRDMDIDYIKSLPDKVEKFCIPVLKSRPNCNRLRHTIWGGELFYDAIPDSMFELYDWLITEIDKRIRKIKPNIWYETIYISNGVYTKRERVWELMKKHHSKISLSYDPIERFSTPEQKEIWYQTYLYFNERLPEVTVTLAMSKRNMETYMKGDEYFEKIQWLGKFDANLYEPCNGANDSNLPSNNDYLNFFIWCLKTKHYSLIDGGHNLNLFKGERKKREDFCIACVPMRFSKWIEDTFHVECASTCVEITPSLPPEIVQGGCDYLVKTDMPIDLCPMVLLSGFDRGCYGCDCFYRCELMPCPFIERDRTVKDCFNRMFYHYADAHPELMKGYWEWRKLYFETLDKKYEKLKSLS